MKGKKEKQNRSNNAPNEKKETKNNINKFEERLNILANSAMKFIAPVRSF